MREVVAFFKRGRACIYCGDGPIKRWDHLVAISKGGDTVLGNMVPACARCDDSKGAKDFREWALGKAKYSPKARGVPDIEKRLDDIDKYVAKHHYYHQLPKDRLDEEELRELKRLQAASRELRKGFDAFFDQYQKRVGGK